MKTARQKNGGIDPFLLHGAAYTPAIRVHQIGSTGTCSRFLGRKSRRIHHCLSLLETDYGLIFDLSPEVVDIREQFPLPREETLKLADKFKIRHPRRFLQRLLRPKQNGDLLVLDQRYVDVVMTTDMVLTMRDGTLLAVHVKYQNDLLKKRVQEKIRIERGFWQAIGVPFRIATEATLPTGLTRNARWLHPSRCELAPETAETAKTLLEGFLGTGMALRDAAHLTDDKLGLPRGAALRHVRHLISTRQWLTDLRDEILPRNPLRITSA